MLTRSDIILEKRVEGNEDSARSEAAAVGREVSRLARSAAATRAAVDGALQNITAGVREGLGGADFLPYDVRGLPYMTSAVGGGRWVPKKQMKGTKSADYCM